MPPLTRMKPRYLALLGYACAVNSERSAHGRIPSQLAIAVEARPSIVMKPKLRYEHQLLDDSLSLCITYPQDLLLAQDIHIMLVGRCTSVLLRDMTDVVVEDICARSFGELYRCVLLVKRIHRVDVRGQRSLLVKKPE